jgi:NTE family protein
VSQTVPVGGDAPDAPRQPADLVLEGGGVKGIGLAGAALELDAAGYTFKRVAGTSAGAIAAALIAALNAAGKPLSQLDDILTSCDYPKFMAKSHLRSALGRVGDAEQLLLHMGVYDADYLVEWLGGVLRQIGVTRFGQLRLDDAGADATLTASQRYTLIVHTSDITRGRCVRLPWDYPAYGRPDVDDELIVDAVRASMSIPFFFDPVRLRAPAASVDGCTYEAGSVTWVDGGMLSNFPVEVFDRCDGAPSRWPTIGIKLSARQTLMAARPDVSNVPDEAIACLHTLLDNADRYYLTADKAAQTIFVDSGGLKATEFHLSTGDQQKLAANGRQAARNWLARAAQRAIPPTV